MAKSRPSVQDIIDFADNLDELCRQHNASCCFSTGLPNSFPLSEVRKLPKALLRGQSSWFQVVFDKPPLGFPTLMGWIIHSSDIGLITPDLETVFTEKLLHSTFTR
jgi:hypothetical protein